MRYRREIDGLRAVAVLSVIPFHAGFSLFGGGFVGVDIFFVISGYLITSLIVAEVAAGGFSIAGFYERRARRILPALFLVVAASAVPAYLWLTPRELADFSESAIATVLFISNFHFMAETGYFAVQSEQKPLLHTWSLAVEEQYYVFVPVVLGFLLARGRRLALAATVALGLASLAVAEWGRTAWPDSNFFMTPGRVWELMIGAAAALASPEPGRALAIPRPLAEIVAAIGAAAVVASIFLFDATTPSPSLWILLPTLGTAALLLAADGRTFVGRALSARAVVAVGLVSYSAYLWHQPLFAYARLLQGDRLDAWMATLLIGATLVLAWLSWRFVERPFRDRARISRRQIASIATGSAFCLVALGGLAVAKGGLPARFGEPEYSFFRSIDALTEARGRCRLRSFLRLDWETPCLIGDLGKRASLLVWGDSHVLALRPGLDTALARIGASAYSASTNACAPVAGSMLSGAARFDRRCREHNEAALAFAEASADIRTVMLVGRWDRYAGEPFGPSPGTEADVACARSHGAQTGLGEGVGATVCRLRRLGKAVVVVRNVPMIGFDPLEKQYDRISRRVETLDISVAFTRRDNQRAPGNAALAGLGFGDVLFFDPFDSLCSEAGTCTVASGGVPYYRDDNHLAGRGAEIVADALLNELSAGAVAERR